MGEGASKFGRRKRRRIGRQVWQGRGEKGKASLGGGKVGEGAGKFIHIIYYIHIGNRTYLHYICD